MAIQLKTRLPGPRSSELMLDRERHVSRALGHSAPIFIARAHGATLEDVDGNVLLDFGSGIGVVNVGHTPKTVSEAISSQAGQLLHACFTITPYEGYVRVAEQLNRRAPGSFAKKSFLTNTGAEAVENAIKIARAHTGRQAVVCFDHGFHGRSYMAMALTSKAQPYKEGFGPHCAEVYRAPFPDVYRWPTGSDPEQVSEQCFRQLEELVQRRIGSAQVAAVIIEPVLGEGGFMPAPAAFLRRVRQLCDQTGIVLIADEVQTGFGRTGTFFACEQLGLVPDLLLSAKGLAAGLPLGAVTGRAEIMDSPKPGGLGGTFGGNPVSCASALEVFASFEDGTLLARSKALGESLRPRLLHLQKRYPVIGDVRGLGGMLAVELVKDRTTKEPHPEAVGQLIRSCYERGLVVLRAGPYGNSLRFLMPLVISEAELAEGLSVVEAAFAELKV